MRRSITFVAVAVLLTPRVSRAPVGVSGISGEISGRSATGTMKSSGKASKLGRVGPRAICVGVLDVDMDIGVVCDVFLR